MGPLEKEIDEEFNRGLRGLPWVLAIIAGEKENLSDVSGPEFMNGLILLLGVIHRNTLRIARKIDATG
jgi:hypothetical protein